MRNTVLLALSLSACIPVSWSDVPGATVTPRADRSTYAEATWAIEVAIVVDEWNTMLEERGCPAPFADVGPGGHDVALLSEDEWYRVGAVGTTTTDYIIVRDRYDRPDRTDVERMNDHLRTLRHELGHAIGLGHASEDDGPTIMAPDFNAVYIQPRDADAAAEILGCR